MTINLNIHLDKPITLYINPDNAVITNILQQLSIHTTKLNQIMATQDEAAAQLEQLAVQLDKVKAEVQKLVDTANQEPSISPRLQAAITSVAGAVQGVDDLNPDAITPPEEPTEPVAPI